MAQRRRAMAGAGIVTLYPDRLAEDGSTPAAPSAGAEQISVALCQASTPQAGSTRHSRAGCSSATSESASCWPTRRAIARSSGSSGSLASRRTLRRWWLRPSWPTQCATRRASFSGPGCPDAHRRGGRRCRARRAPPRRRRIACTGHPDVHDVGGYRCSRRLGRPALHGRLASRGFCVAAERQPVERRAGHLVVVDSCPRPELGPASVGWSLRSRCTSAARDALVRVGCAYSGRGLPR
jgi:hypothetical protein